MEKLYIPWHEYLVDCELLAMNIKEKGIHQLPMLAISRGGLIPGTIISHKLNNPIIEVIGVRSYNNEYHLIDVHEIYQKPENTYNAVLIIDDLVDSGYTLNVVKEYLQQKNSKVEIYVAVIYSKKIDYKVDCKVKELDPKKWVVFPYEI